jgi:hypothetical protein
MEVFSYTGEAFATGYFGSTTTATATGFKGADKIIVAGTDVTSTTPGEVFEPLRGAFSGLRAKAARISAESFAIVYTIDGTTPTVTAAGSYGHVVAVGGTVDIMGENNIRNFKCMNAVASSGAIVRFSMFAW